MACRERQKTADFRTDYASRADFCEIFERELKPLYLLAFLLTANQKRAEQCFATTILDQAQIDQERDCHGLLNTNSH